MKSFWIVDTTGRVTLAIGEDIAAARNWFSRTHTDRVRAYDVPAKQCPHCSNYITITVTKFGDGFKHTSPDNCTCIKGSAFASQLSTHFTD